MKRKVSVDLPPDVAAPLEKLKQSTGVSLTFMIVQALRDYLRIKPAKGTRK